MFTNGYRGAQGGSVQTTYSDQPGVGIPGQIAFASDENLLDAYFIGEPDGIAAGLGVQLELATEEFQSVPVNISLQRPNMAAFLPAAGKTVSNFGGILVFDESMQSDEHGIPGYAMGRVGRFARPQRSGARIYVLAVEAIDPASATVNWVVVGGTNGLYLAGQFAPAVLGSTAPLGYSTDLSSVAQYVSKAAAGEEAIIELF